MAPETGTALLVLVAFVLPGFVAVLIGERTHEVPVRHRTAFELLLLTGYYSVLTYGLVTLVTWPFGFSRETLRDWYREESLGRLGALGLVAIFVVPALLGTIARLWMRSSLRLHLLRLLNIHETHRISAAWDEFFRRGEPAFVRVVLTDRRVVGVSTGPAASLGTPITGAISSSSRRGSSTTMIGSRLQRPEVPDCGFPAGRSSRWSFTIYRRRSRLNEQERNHETKTSPAPWTRTEQRRAPSAQQCAPAVGAATEAGTLAEIMSDGDEYRLEEGHPRPYPAEAGQGPLGHKQSAREVESRTVGEMHTPPANAPVPSRPPEKRPDAARSVRAPDGRAEDPPQRR